MAQEDLDRVGNVVDRALLEIGQACCYRMQVSEVVDQAYTAHVLLNCARHWPISFDVVYTTDTGDHSDAYLRQLIIPPIRALTPHYGRNVRVRITSNTTHQGQVGIIVGFRGHSQDMAGAVEEYWVRFDGDDSGPYPYADHDFEPAD